MERKRLSLIILFALFVGAAMAPKKEKKEVLFTVSGDPVYLEEFKYVYNKSNGRQDDAYTEESLREYLDLYTNFRLKIREAEELKMDTSEAFLEELQKYRSQAAQPYLSSKEAIDGLVKEAYERKKEEVRVSHILIKTLREDDPADTLTAYKKIKGLKDKLDEGVDFAKIARSYSEDPSAVQNSGDLGYFSSLSMVYSFENKAYNTPVGEISSIFRTDFGYHVLKVTGRRPSTGKVKVAHIMIRASAGMDSEDSLAAKQKVDEIYKELKNGADWAKMVSEYSEDGYSKTKEGELDPMDVNARIVPEFKETALSLKPPGEITEPFLSPYGWHIIKFISRQDLKSFDEMEKEIRNWVEKDGRSRMSKRALAKRLKGQNNYKEYVKNLIWLSQNVDSSILKGSFIPNKTNKGYSKPLFSINKEPYTSLDYLEHLKMKRPKTNISPEYFVKYHFQNYANASLIQYEEDHLEDNNYDFKMLMEEYHDGILMFNLMEEKIWNESTRDTAGLREFFNSREKDFQWGSRADAWIMDCKSKKILQQVDREIETGLFSVARPIPGTFYYNYRKKEVEEKDLKNIIARLKSLTNKKDLRATLTVYSYPKESAGSNKKINSDRIEFLKQKFQDEGLAMESIKFVDGGTKTDEKDLEKARRVHLLFNSVNPKDLQANLNKEAPLSLNARVGKFEKGDNDFLDKVEWKEGTYLVPNGERQVRIKIFEIEEPRAKKLDEVKGEAISAYQDHLEKEWIKELKAKYPVVQNEEVFKTLIKANP